MSCTCKKNTTNRCNCNGCNDKGCLNFVYPECILTKDKYPCIGVAGGVSGTTLFAAIDAAICTLQGRSTVVEGCTQTLSSGDYVTITSDKTVSGGKTTYKICLGSDIITLLNELQSSASNADNFIDQASGCLFDASGNCQIDNLSLEITTINNTITSLEPETWKLVGAGGTMANGQPVPNFAAGVVNFPSGEPLRLRALAYNYRELSGTVQVTVTDSTPQPIFIVTLPTGYRPAYTMTYSINLGTGISSPLIPAAINIATTGEVYLLILEGLSPTPLEIGLPIHMTFTTN